MAGSFRFEEGQAMKPTVYMEEMDAFTYREKLAKDAVVFIPVGALEQHGSHMACLLYTSRCVKRQRVPRLLPAPRRRPDPGSPGDVERLVA